jgi:hypothetical protein
VCPCALLSSAERCLDGADPYIGLPDGITDGITDDDHESIL